MKTRRCHGCNEHKPEDQFPADPAVPNLCAECDLLVRSPDEPMEEAHEKGYGKNESPGILSDGSPAPPNTDKARLDYISRRPCILKNHMKGVRAANVAYSQPSVRAAIDAAMETERIKLRSRGLKPEW